MTNHLVEIIARANAKADDEWTEETGVSLDVYLAQAMLKAIDEAGYAVCPKEISEETYMAMCDADNCEWEDDSPPDQFYARLYKAAMLAAAPNHGEDDG